MPMYSRLLLVAACLGCHAVAFTQSLVVTCQNPDALYVCGTDTLRISLQNTTAGPLAGPAITVALPAGIAYLAGSAGGAVESNIANPNAPQFTVPDLAANTGLTFFLVVQAGCDLIGPINNGQQFANTVTVTYSGGSEQLTTDFFKVETALLSVTSVVPATQPGLGGSVLTRTVTLRNTRQGPVNTLEFTDLHPAGISIQLSGVSGQNTATVFSATVPGSYFTAFGDGDALFEFDETVTLTEEITVLDCGIPPLTVGSIIRVGWGCDGTVCQSDSTQAIVQIQPSSQNPNLLFVPVYGAPPSYCGAAPAVQELLVINTGNALAEEINVELSGADAGRLGLDFNSFQLNDGSGWAAWTPVSGEMTVLDACNLGGYYGKVSLDLPPIAPGDTLRLRFANYFCQPRCQADNVGFSGKYSYRRICPVAGTITGSLTILPNSADLELLAAIHYDIGTCLQDGMTYKFDYFAESKRLLTATGFLEVVLRLPWGLHWDPSCIPVLDGKTPVLIETDSIANVSSTVRLAYPLPFSTDSAGDLICLRYFCDSSMSCAPSLPNPPPRGLDFRLYATPESCTQCIVNVVCETAILPALDTPVTCGVLVCDAFELVVDNTCGAGGGGGGDGGLGGLNLATSRFNSYRLNVGLRDDDDDRIADNSSPADSPELRLDRFLPGDTMRTELGVAVQAGQLSQVRFRLFLESLKSDFGKNGGDEYSITAGKPLFVNYDETAFIGGELTIHTTAGQQYTCPVGTPEIRSDQHIITLLPPNKRPADVLDELSSMFHEFDLDMAALAASGCVPSGFVLSAGDSLAFSADFTFRQNFVPASQAVPPLVNFRNVICGTNRVFAWDNAGCMPYQLRQYSGYKERILPPVYRIEPCSDATELSAFRYSMRIARENLFPFEVRPLARLLDFRQTLPPGIPLLEAQLRYLQLQENKPVFGSQMLPLNVVNNTLLVDFQPFFTTLPDEGFHLETGLKFGADCTYKKPKSATTTVKVAYFSNEFHSPNPFTAEVTSPAAYPDGSPELSLTLPGAAMPLTGKDLTVDMLLENPDGSPSPNTWLSWETTGDLGGVQLLLVSQQQAAPLTGNVFQLGTLDGLSELSLRFTGTLKTCEPVSVTFGYGWDCNPVALPDSGLCGYYEKTITIVPALPELELVVLGQPDAVPMCAPSDVFEFEIYNAADGQAFGVQGSVKLPAGLTLVPGSSRLSYPSGSAFVSLPDPAALPGNVFLWNPAAVSAALADQGLKSIGNEPENALRIRFRVQAECGFVANTRPVYGAEAVLPCGIASNTLRKPGDPVRLQGFGPSYNVNASLAYAQPPGGLDCGASTTLDAALTLDGMSHAGDGIFILLPDGVSYAAGSYVPGQNAPGGPPEILGNTLRLPFPADLPSNSTVKFSFGVRYDSPGGCTDKAVQLQVRENAAVLCPPSGEECAVYFAAGETVLILAAQNPDLVLQQFSAAVSGNALSFTAGLQNEGNGTASDPLVQFYLDGNGNGTVDAGEPLVGAVNAGQSLAPGASASLAGALNLPASALCQLLAVIPGEANCACADKVYPPGQNPALTTVVGFCDVLSAPIGVDSAAGHTYAWLTPGGLSCTDCARAVYAPGPDVQPGSTVVLLLEETTGACTITHRFELQFGIVPEWDVPDPAICRGESIQLSPAPGGAYQWSGPGIGNPAAGVQTVQPGQSSTYSVTITFAGGCTGTGAVTVYVIPVDSLDLGTLVTCAGNPVDVFGALTDIAGIYTQKLKNSGGCDSISTLRVVVYPSETFLTRSICPGDSVPVFDTSLTTAGQLCRTFIGVSGCDSTHCIAVELLPGPVLPAVQDSFVIGTGEEIRLEGPPGFVTYAWAPVAGLSCGDCPDPLASPDTTTFYLLTVGDTSGCEAAVTYRVLLCDFEKLLVPNAFTPNGDGINDVFRIVPTENIAEVYSLTVYNRWGQQVWQGSGAGAAWDGTVNGRPAPSDVYAWLLEGGCGGEVRSKKGNIGLLR